MDATDSMEGRNRTSLAARLLQPDQPPAATLASREVEPVTEPPPRIQAITQIELMIVTIPSSNPRSV